jgi:N-methylhydantoinase A
VFDGFERAIEERIRKTIAPVFVSRSSEVLPVYKEYERGVATWLNAALGPVVSGYLKRLQAELGDCPLQIMQSSGETIAAEKAQEATVNLLLSGPAGGLTAIQFLGKQIGVEKIISFDMGGTSTDVALLDREINMTTEGVIGCYPIGVPMVDMHTIGAGGGSIAFIDSGGMLQVGPRSAGADPGPACYGKGGKDATVTDANLVLGRLIHDVAFADNMKLDKQLAVSAIEKLANQIGS